VSSSSPETSGATPYDYDVLVIGAGPGGYVAAIRAAQLGAKVAVVEKNSLGGTCLNVGCIPTKAVISSVALYRNMLDAKRFGLSASNIAFDQSQIVDGARGVVKQLVRGVGTLLKKNGVTQITGTAAFADNHTVLIDGGKKVTARNIIIATGSTATRIRVEGLDTFPKVWTSDDAVFATEVPQHLAVIGGGAVGLEFAFIFNALGAKVTVVEMLPHILPAADEEAAAELTRHLKKQGLDIRTGASFTRASAGKITIQKDGKAEEIPADVVLLAVGRRPSTAGLNLEALGMKMNRAAIAVNQYYETSVPGIYAIGDAIGEPLLAHAASAEGEAAAANVMGGHEKVNYDAMPAAVYTHPELASVGHSEATCREKYPDVAVGKFFFVANGRALGEREAEGFAKIIISEKHGQILGAYIVGPHASDLIAECATAMASELTIDELIASVHAHPTLSEVVFEAAHDARRRCIHKA